ncbi:ATP-binding protein [Acrocarpospora sp. B8E8]|uniref:ATP-binding protein n=1 Tax=Acrocarpospora sp. B8E8 TaxID=3153572 RepID=UPI00325F4BD4
MTSATTTATSIGSSGLNTPQFPPGVDVVGSQMRSTNLERDVLDELHAPYIGARAVDVLERVASALADDRRARAWSFTGPYGSGKSTLANLIDALLGHDQPRREEAEALLRDTSPSLVRRLAAGRDAFAPNGFLGAVATARREPLVATLSRGLHTAATRRWNRRIPKSIATALAACADPATATSKHVIDAVTALCTEQSAHPVLLVIDEFGKTLEHLAGHGEFASATHDLFLLQELAEISAGRNGLPLILMTLQHLSFMDYAARSSELQTREWAKIQGRFEDVTFLPHLGDSVQLIRRRLDHSGVDATGHTLIRDQANAAAAAWRNYGLNVIVDLTAEDFTDLYPLHPLTAVAAPFLAAQIGQHDRSLSGFLNNDEPDTIRRALQEFSTPTPQRASTVRLPQLYDYFMSSGRTTLLASTNASRWIEIEARINESRGLPDPDQNLLKTVGMLNLIDSDGALRASAPMIYFALHDPTDVSDPAAFTVLERQLQDLVRRGFLVYREFSGEYRVWRGTDIDIDARLKDIVNHLDRASVVQRLGAHVPQSVVAGRHSQVTGMMRAFFTAVSGPETDSITGPKVLNELADGLLVFHLGTMDDLPSIDIPVPVIVGTTQEPDVILQAATYLVALDELLQDQTLDSVARREIIERSVEARAETNELLASAFYPPTQRATWHLWGSGITSSSTATGEPIHARSLSGLVSLACDSIFSATPHIRNEMLGRHKLTSQASKARRELLTEMLRNSGNQFLGIEGYGPERAMYSGVLEYMGLHRMDGATAADQQADNLVRYGFSRPSPAHKHAQPVWQALETSLTQAAKRTDLAEIFRIVGAPPYGVKAGVAPLLVATALIIRSDDMALFEEGSYLPRLSPDTIERMVKAPHRFEIKYTPVGDGQRRNVIQMLSVALGVAPPPSRSVRNPAILSVARALLERVMVLTPYARRTRRISADAVTVRSALLNAQDPDELLFYSLPESLGLKPITTDQDTSTKQASEYVNRLTAAADEISNAEATVRTEAVQTIAKEFRLPSDLPQLRATMATRLRGFADVSLNTELRGFVAIALNESLGHDDWLDPLIVRLSHSAIGDWSDGDAAIFPRRVREMAQALDRVSHLYQERQRTAQQADKLEARLLTLTTPAGTEQRTLIYMPQQSRHDADQLAASVLEQAQRTLGPDGARILLAVLTQRLVDAPDDPASALQE